MMHNLIRFQIWPQPVGNLQKVHRHLPMLLWESAKFWTLANVIIYTLPLRFQVNLYRSYDEGVPKSALLLN
jgi:hypothetical protein